MIRLACAFSFLAVVLVIAMVARPNAYTTFLCMFIGQPALAVAVGLFVLHPVHSRPVHNHQAHQPAKSDPEARDV